MNICVSSAAGPIDVNEAAVQRGWRYDESAEVSDPNSMSGYYRNPSHRDLMVETMTYDGLPPPLPEDDGMRGRGAAQIARVAAVAADRAADAAALRMGRLRSREGLEEVSCALLTDVGAETLVGEVSAQLGFPPNAPTTDSPTLWVFHRSGEALIARPEIQPTRGHVQSSAARSGPLHTVSIARIQADGLPSYAIRYTRYHALPREAARAGGSISEFSRVCMDTGADPAGARSASAGVWSRHQPAGLTAGAEAYQGPGGQLFISETQSGEFHIQRCVIQFDGPDFEEAVEHVGLNMGTEPDILSGGTRRWFFRGSVSRPAMLATDGTPITDAALQTAVAAHGVVYSINVVPGLTGRMILTRFSP